MADTHHNPGHIYFVLLLVLETISIHIHIELMNFRFVFSLFTLNYPNCVLYYR